MAITRAQQYKQLLSNGGSTNDISLEEAKDMAPKGEFLAYINKKEAKMLKDAGGSGIMTNAGIPSFRPQDFGQEAASKKSGFDQSDTSNPYSQASQDANKAFNDAIRDSERGKQQTANTQAAINRAQEKKKLNLNIPDFKTAAKKGINFFRKSYYNRFPNNPKRELEYLASLQITDPAKYNSLPQNLKDLLNDTRIGLNKIADDGSFKDAPKFSFEDFESLRQFDDGAFAKYAAERGSPGLKYSGDMSQVGIKSIRRDKITGEPIKDMFGNTLFDYGPPDGPGAGGGGDGGMSDYERRLLELEKAMATADATPVEEDQIINYRLMADGGRAAFAGGGKDAGAGSNFGNENFGGGDGNARENYRTQQYKKSKTTTSGGNGPPTNVGGNGITTLTSKKNIPTLNTDFSKFTLKDLIGYGLVNPEEENTQLAMITDTQKGIIDKQGNIGKLTGAFNPNATFDAAKGTFDKETNTYGFDDKGSKGVLGIGAKDAEPMTREEFDAYVQEKGYATGGRIGLMEGGMPYEGGIMDLESARQMYGLGKLVKKITRGVKKIVKSPIGKAALIGGLGYLARSGGLNTFFKSGGQGSIFSKLFGANNTMKGFANISTAKMPGFLSKIGLTQGFGSIMPTALGGIAATTLGSYFLTPEEEEQKLASLGADIDDPRIIMNDPYKYINRRLVAEGGSIEEPVAKKTMPLLDMDGQEMDLRAEGGFVPLGRMERADDVPARLSKNEFVFTADAVRNAGEGDVDKGAEVMYNMMKNLESGGDVSEESQGLEGARDMFQTSQRLEEVI